MYIGTYNIPKLQVQIFDATQEIINGGDVMRKKKFDLQALPYLLDQLKPYVKGTVQRQVTGVESGINR